VSEWFVVGPLVAQLVVEILLRDFGAPAELQPVLNSDGKLFCVSLTEGSLCEPEWRRVHREARENCARIFREAREEGRKDRQHARRRRKAA